MTNLVIAISAWWLATVPVYGAGDLDPGYWEQTPLPQTGFVTYYNPGIMDIVEDYREQQGQLPDCPECVGTVAMLRGGDIGRIVWLKLADGESVGPLMVVDCAHPKHVPALIAKGWVLDVSYELGVSLGVNRPLPVTVLDSPEPVEPKDQDSPPAETAELPAQADAGAPPPVAPEPPLAATPTPGPSVPVSHDGPDAEEEFLRVQPATRGQPDPSPAARRWPDQYARRFRADP